MTDPNPYRQRGLRTLINAKGPATRLSGGIMRPEVIAAMAAAAGHCIDMAELEAHASEVIADITGAEAGYVASGAAACLLLATAACVTGLDPGRMARLPDTTGMRNEIVIVRSQRNFYDHAVRAAGIRLIEVGLPDRYAGAGLRDAETWEIADAITDRTAGVFYVTDRLARPPLRDVIAVAHAASVPVIVDAAAQLPPQANLRRFISEGADLVAFSGGKAINGPQATRHSLRPARSRHGGRPPASRPRHFLGTMGAAAPAHRQGASEGGAAARHWSHRQGRQGADHRPPDRPRVVRGRHQRWRTLVEALAAKLDGLPATTLAVTGIGNVEEVPTVVLTLAKDSPISALELVTALQNGTPPVAADPTLCDDGVVIFNPLCLQPTEPELIAAAVRRVLAGGA